MKIEITLGDSKSTRNAINELKKYRDDIKKKTQTLRQIIAEKIAIKADYVFSQSIVSDIFLGDEPRKADVEVTIDESENLSIVIAKGEDAIWVEFGAGVYHNTSVGTSPHPMGSQLGFTIGGYGEGKGANKTWFYKGDNEQWIGTKGTRATMPLFMAVEEIRDEILEIAREVFK